MDPVSVVVPVYNGAKTLQALTMRLQNVLKSCTTNHEIVFVNDGSPDESWSVICELSRGGSAVHGINLMRNYGQHNALLCGIRSARYPVIVTIDDDLQQPPEEIPTLLKKLAEGYDVVYGPPLAERHEFWRDLASQLTKLAMQGAMGVDIARNIGPFRAFRTQVRDAFASYQGAFVSIDVLLTWGAARFAAVPVQYAPRTVGRSNYTFRKLVVHALNMITGFSVVPLQLASLMGFGFTTFGCVVLVYVIGRYVIEGGSPPGFPFLASVIAIFSGAQLFALGIMGEYLARIHQRTMERPSYVVGGDTGGST
jgi:glycosyltransferase involved in cell wall biosynthesis